MTLVSQSFTRHPHTNHTLTLILTCLTIVLLYTLENVYYCEQCYCLNYHTNWL